jgi:hypothetical protein
MTVCATNPYITVTVGPEDAVEPLVISSACDGEGIEWTELVLPEWSLRMTYAPPSAYVPGNVLLAAVEDSGEVGMVVTLEATSAAGLETLKTTLGNALAAWPGVVTVKLVEDAGETVIGGPWQSFPTRPRWGDMKALLNGIYLIDGAFSIPVNPPGAP